MIWKKRTTHFPRDEQEENDESLDENEKEYRVTYGRIYTDKVSSVKRNTLTTKKFERILMKDVK